MVFPVVMYGCESWSIKKAERQRIDAFELWCWRRLLRVPWTARRSNQSILKEIHPEYSLEGLILKLQYFGHLMRRADSLEKTLMLGKIEGRGRRGWRRDEMVGWHHQLDGHECEQAPGFGDGQGSLVCYSPCSRKQSDTSKLLSWLIKWRACPHQLELGVFSPTPWGNLMTINYLCQQKAVFKFSWKKAEWGLIWFGAFLMSEPKAQSLRKREGVGLWA